MNRFIKDHLEDYLENRLPKAQRRRFESILAEDAASSEQVQALRELSGVFSAIRVEGTVAPEPGFYARVNQLVEQERNTPFWLALIQPKLLKGLAFASLMWLFLLGSFTVMTDGATERSTRLADIILEQQPPTEHFFVRLGADLNQNRNSMLAVMMSHSQGD